MNSFNAALNKGGVKMRSRVLVLCSALALTGCTTVVVESVPTESKALSPMELQIQTNQFECNELNLVWRDFYVDTLWNGENPALAAAFYEPFDARKNKTASDIAGWMRLSISSYNAFLAWSDGADEEDLSWSTAARALWEDLQATCSEAGVPLLGVPLFDSLN